jgi:hypothetical protein
LFLKVFVQLAEKGEEVVVEKGCGRHEWEVLEMFVKKTDTTSKYS